eukprot:248158-Pelagomonas_calceolata.AAC.1
MDEPNLLLLRPLSWGCNTEAKDNMVSVGVHTTHSWTWTSEDMINAVHINTQRASSIGGRPIEYSGMLLCVDCPCA